MGTDPYQAVRAIAEQDAPLTAQDVLTISQAVAGSPTWAEDMGHGILISLVMQLEQFLESYDGTEIKALPNYRDIFRESARQAAVDQTIINLQNVEANEQAYFREYSQILKDKMALAENTQRQIFVHGSAFTFTPVK